MTRSALLLALAFPLIALAAKPTPAAAAAKKALEAIQKPGNLPDVATQVRLVLTELGEEEVYGLPAPLRAVLTALSAADPETRGPMLDASLEEIARPFLKDACGKDDAAALVSLSLDAVTSTCHLKQRKALPAKVVVGMRPGALLLAAFVADQLGKKASVDELTLARWLAHVGRGDVAAAALTRP